MAKDLEMRKVGSMAALVIKDCKYVEKMRNITEMERNSAKSARKVAESTLRMSDILRIKENLLISMRTLLELKKLPKKSSESIMAYKSKLEDEMKESKRDVKLESVLKMVKSQNSEEKSQGFLDLSHHIKLKWNSEVMNYVSEAVECLCSDNENLATHSGMFLLEAVIYDENIFSINRDKILGCINSKFPEVRALVSLICSRVEDLKAIQSLITLSSDRSSVNVRELEIPDQMTSFQRNGDMAIIADIVKDSIFQIVDSTKDPSNYLTMSVSYYLSGTKKEGDELSIVFKIRPIVRMEKLTLNLSSLLPAFDLVGQPEIILSDLEPNAYHEREVRAIPMNSGHLRGSVMLLTSNGWKGEIVIDEIFEAKPRPVPIMNDQEVQAKQNNEEVESKKGRSSANIELIIRDIQTMETRKVVNALNQLKLYTVGDENLESRISAMAINLSLKGTDKITKSEADTILEMADNVKQKI